MLNRERLEKRLTNLNPFSAALLLLCPVAAYGFMPEQFCAGCAESTWTTDTDAECTIKRDEEPGGYVSKCRVEAQLVIGSSSENCSTQNSDCSSSVCGRDWQLHVDADPLDTNGCNGIVFSFEERLNNGTWSTLGPNVHNATDYLDGYTQVYPTEGEATLRAICSQRSKKDIKLIVQATGVGTWLVDCSDDIMEMDLLCTSCTN